MSTRHISKKNTLSLLSPGLFMIGLLFSGLSIHGQYNYLSNPSFEDTVQCIPNAYELSDTITVNWSSPTLATPDGLYECNGFVPELPSWYGPWHYEYAKHGKGYGGVYAIYYLGIYREYMQGQLKQPLIAGTEYCVSFYVSPADSVNLVCDGMGIYFSDTAVFGDTSNTLLFTPQVSNPVGNILANKNGWTQISGSFIADGGEAFVIIGNFMDVFSVNYTDAGGAYPEHSYYLVDAISVTESGQMAYAGNDTSIFAGDSVFIGSPDVSAEINWYQQGTLINTGHTGIYVQPATSTWYVLEQELCGANYYDTIYVNVIQHSGIAARAHQPASVFPNPTDGVIKIQSAETGTPGIFCLYDLAGALILSCCFEETITLSIDELARGSYFYSVLTDGEVSISTGLLILQ